MDDRPQHVTIGILALQGAFAEHQVMLQKLSVVRRRKVLTAQVRTPEDLARCDALIIPGGESTTMALLIRLSALQEPLRDFLARKPVWGTCAGAILLATSVVGAKRGGQELLGGVELTIERNGWGSQVESFEATLDLVDVPEAAGEEEGFKDKERGYQGIFIRAPVVLAFTPTPGAPPIQVIARLPNRLLPHNGLSTPSSPSPLDLNDCDTVAAPTPPPDGAALWNRLNSVGDPRTVVALRQGRHMLTTFHPELTQDGRFHEYFVRECVLGP